ncbi:hypothetical protein MFAL_38760 [Mycolicibacterium fallax]|nr:hypothetical protein MFAL_38760 [Mycolicibacterium fallax]
MLFPYRDLGTGGADSCSAETGYPQAVTRLQLGPGMEPGRGGGAVGSMDGGAGGAGRARWTVGPEGRKGPEGGRARWGLVDGGAVGPEGERTRWAAGAVSGGARWGRRATGPGGVVARYGTESLTPRNRRS